MAVITKGIQLLFAGDTNGSQVVSTDCGWTRVGSETYLIPDLQEVGDLVGAQGGSRDKIEVTTLADDKHVYVDGLLSEENADGIEFKLLYSPKSYKNFLDIIENEKKGSNSNYTLTIPASQNKQSQFKMEATSAIKVDSAGVNSAMTMTLTLTPADVIQFVAEADPIATTAE